MAITEDYVRFETAKLLKEKGFDVPCLAHWYIGSEVYEEFSDHPFNWNEVKSDLDWLSRPTQQMAMKWLREVHNIHIYTIDTFIGFKYVIQDMLHHDEDIHPIDGICFSSNEEACEAAIKYCLEHLI